MPIRIYDIAKKLGIESKDVLAKAKELSIAAAKFPSSHLDKISGEWLEEEIIKSRPDIAAKLASGPVEESPNLAGDGTNRPAIGDLINVIHAAPPKVVQSKSQFTITCTGTKFDNLVEPIRNGEVEFRLNVNGEIFDFCLVRGGENKLLGAKPKFDLPNRVEIGEQTKDLLLAAFYSAKHRAIDGWLNLAELGSAIKKIDPTFQLQKFGEKGLGGLLRRVDLFELRNDESNPIIYYLRLKTPNGLIPSMQPTGSKTNPSSSEKVATGKIHNLRPGFGFIVPDDGSENAFFHATDIEGCTIYDLKPGDAVEYEPGFNERGPCARKIRRLPG